MKMSFLSTAAGLILIAGAGGAMFAAYTFRAPWWATTLFGIAGFLIGLLASVIYGRLSQKLQAAEKQAPSARLAQIIYYTLPFISVAFVSCVTVFSTIAITLQVWPEESREPRDYEFLEKTL